MECHRCGYKWESKSALLRVSCPSCGTKVKTRIFLLMEAEKPKKRMRV